MKIPFGFRAAVIGFAFCGLRAEACPFDALAPSAGSAARPPAPAKPPKPLATDDVKAVLTVLAAQAPQLSAAVRAREQMVTRAAFLDKPSQAKGISDKVRTGTGKLNEAEADWMKALMATAKDGYVLPREVQERFARVESKIKAGESVSRSDVDAVLDYAPKLAAAQAGAVAKAKADEKKARDRVEAGAAYPLFNLKLSGGRSKLTPQDKIQLERMLGLAEAESFPAEKAVIAEIRAAAKNDSYVPPVTWKKFTEKHWWRFVDMARDPRQPAAAADASAYLGPEADKTRAAIAEKVAKGKTLDPTETAWVRGASTVLQRDRRLDAQALHRLRPE